MIYRSNVAWRYVLIAVITGLVSAIVIGTFSWVVSDIYSSPTYNCSAEVSRWRNDVPIIRMKLEALNKSEVLVGCSQEPDLCVKIFEQGDGVFCFPCLYYWERIYYKTAEEPLTLCITIIGLFGFILLYIILFLALNVRCYIRRGSYEESTALAA